MDPDINLEWLDKHEPEEEEQQVGNICRSWQWRERGLNPPKEPSNKRVLENVAEDILVQKPLNIKCCDLPGHPRSTFLMVFSPDGTKVASTHGNHNVYVSELSSGKHVRILQGHPRTPWCIAFHPSHPQLIGSGCLGGQVRVWDLSGGSETWTVANKTVIASIAFHPRDQLLVIATFNELYFWDWSLRAPFTRVCTHSVSEKVRYVAFDSLGYKLITGISVWSRGNTSYSLLQNINQGPSAATPRAEDNNAPNQGNNQPDSPPENIVTSYQNLVQRYDNLVRNYERLFLARHPLLNLDVANANTTDRGTDPMETDALTRNAYYPWSLHSAALYRARQLADAGVALSNQNESDNADGENSNGRLFNFDVLSLGSNPPRPLESDHDYYGPQNDPELSRTPASQRYNGPHPTLRPTLRTRLLPNPFSSNNLSRSDTVTFSNNNNQPEAGTSRTSVFTSHRQDSPSARFFMHRRQTSGTRHLHFGSPTVERAPAPTPANAPSPPPAPTPAPTAPRPAATPPATASPSASTSSASRPPPADPTTAYTIRECLELFREILRDSGHRLSNIISNMSLATIADIDRSLPRRHAATSDDSDGPNRTNRRPRLRIYNAAFRRELLSTDTESEDSDRSVEVNLRDTTFRRGSNNADPRTSRFHINLSDTHIDQSSPIAAEFFSGRRFRIRRHSTDDNVSRQQSTSADGNSAEPGRTRTEPPDSDPNRPSTSRDTRNTNDPLGISANESSTLTTEEAFAKVRLGVAALRKHTVHLTDLWLRGVPTTMRELRTMWENLRRRTLSLQRQTGTQDVPSYFSRDLMERCRMLTHTTRRGVRRPRDRRANNSSTNDDAQQQASTSSTSSSVPTETEAPRPRLRRSFLPPLRRRPTVAPRSARSARISRSYDVYCTRNEIRMRAMQVLTAMFNMMMNCLEQRGLSHIIIHMLRMLKKALALTCLMLVAAGRQHRQNPEGNLRSRRNAASNASNDETQDDMFDFLSDQNLRRPSERVADHARRSNTRHDDDESSVSSSESDEKHTEKSQSDAERKDTSPEPSTSRQAIGRWSNRLAVQIAAANRNNSNTARSRRDLYLETKRQKALHKTNPSAHPISKKRVMPPSVTSRIPSIRRTPARQPNERSSPKPLQRATEPVAGPSSRPDAPTDPYNRYDADFENRVNLLRIAAHMHAVRMRTAASRTRFRRLQAIRLYTPYSVREMFSLQSNNQANQGIVSDRPSPMSPDRPSANASPNQAPTLNENMFEGPGQLDFVLNNAPVPPGDEANNSQRQNAQPQRPTPPPQDYLQPIILAQNALVVDEGGGGGGDAPTFGSFLDAGFSSESIPSYTHRVQAWDFTKGETPDIADSLKNIVVPRCRIHNDASIDISKDGRFLVAFLPVPRLRNANHWLGVYSLEWPRLGQCLHTAMLEQSAVSVALSPTARYLAVGVGSRRFTTLPSARTNVFALLYKLQPSEDSERTALAPIKELEQNWQQGLTSLNCLRWAPQPGQGLVYANNTGQLIIMS